jgi:hypothetical protein
MSRGKQSKIGIYNGAFLDRLVGVRGQRTKLIDPGINVMEVCSLRRSLCRGSTQKGYQQERSKRDYLEEELVEQVGDSLWQESGHVDGKPPCAAAKLAAYSLATCRRKQEM